MAKIKKGILCLLIMFTCLPSMARTSLISAEVGTTNLALSADAEVSVVTDDNGQLRGGENINDGNKATYWDSGAKDDAYAILDFKEVKDLGSIKVFNYVGKVWQQSYDRWYQYEILVSNDKTNWTKVGEKKNENIATTAGDTYNFPTGVEAQYVKLVSFGGNNADARIFHLLELEAYEYLEGAPLANVALNKPVTGTGTTATITDGNLNNYCDLGVAPSAFVIDLEDYYDIDEIVAFPYFAGGRNYKYYIESSVDGLNYTKIGEKQDDAAATPSGKSFAFNEELIARYIRITMTYNSANSSVHMNEVQVYGQKAEGYTPPPPLTEDPSDPDNIAFHKPTRANMNKVASNLIVDSSNDTAWSSLSFPANVDVDLQANYNLDEIVLNFPVAPDRYYQYTVYTSVDGINFDRVAQKRNHDLADADGDVWQLDGKEARIIRVNVEHCSQGASAFLSELRVHGEESGNAVTPRAELSIPAFEDSAYAAPISEQDTIDEIYNLIERLIGSGYEDYFTFDIVPSEDGNDYYEISDQGGKIHIVGNKGVSITTGLNYYLKYFCNVHISQQNEQIATMPAPDAVIPVGETIHKDTPLDVRYAYNYCTNSYTNAFFGIDEWQRELDWMALNGVNLVLDISGQEAVWVDYLQKIGYSTDDAKSWLTGPSYYAWQFMSNMENYGGPISDQYVLDKLELARRNQYQMRLLGMTPVLQGYAGMLPSDYASIVKDKPEFKEYADALIDQGIWGGGFTRPFMFDPRSDLFEDTAQKFYESQRKVLGDTSNYYAVDPFHEGGIRPSGLSDAQTSSEVLSAMMDFDADAVWTIQSWEGNPTKGLLDGIGVNKADHALVLDLNATMDPRYSNASWGDEFYGTPWVYCMLDNFGDRPGVHGELSVIAKLPSVISNTNNAYMSGIGITPEGMRMNPVNYEMFFETAWEDENIDPEAWLKDYVTRRYGTYSEDAYQGWLGLLDTAYGETANHWGGFNARLNYRPDRNSAILGQTTSIPYDPAKFERAVEDLLKDYDVLKDNEAYQYDLVAVLREVLQNSQLSYYNKFMAAAPGSEAFETNAALLLDSILLVDQVSATQEDELLGNWIGMANDWSADYDDFSKDIFEIQSKTLITTWGSRTTATTLGDYAYRQYAGLEKDYVYPRWEEYIQARREGKNITYDEYFNDSFDFVLNNVDYTRETTDAATELKTLSEEIMEDYTVYAVDVEVVDDNVAILGYGQSSNGAGGGNPVSNINDKNASTLWVAGNGNTPSTVTIELDDIYDVYKIQARFEEGPYTRGLYMDYNIEVFNEDSQAWEKVYEGTTADGTIGTETFPDLITTDQVRITITSVDSPLYPAIAELEVYASSGIKLVEESTLTLAEAEVSGIEAGKTVADVLAELTANVGDIKIFRGDVELGATDKVQAGDIAKLFVEEDIEVDTVTLQVAVDKSALQALVDSTSTLDEAIYTPNSYEALQTALDDAQAVLDNADATQVEVDAAVTDLQTVIDALVMKADKSVLNTLIDDADTKVEEAYTAESWATFESALADAQAISADDNATQEQVNSAAEALSNAINALEAVQEESVNTDALQQLISASEALIEEAYTPESWSVLADALASAKEVLANPEVTQADVDAAAAQLQAAKEALVAVQGEEVNTEALQQLIKAIEALNANDYTTASWKQLQEVLADAKATLANPEASQADIDAQVKALQAAKDKLVKKVPVIEKPSIAPTAPAVSGNGGGTNTGDTTNVNFLYAMLLVSGVVVVRRYWKKKVQG